MKRQKISPFSRIRPSEKSDIRTFELSAGYPNYLVTIDESNEMGFYKADGRLFTKYNLKDALFSTADLQAVQSEFRHYQMGIFKVRKNYFVVLIKNFAFVVKLIYEKRLQKFTVSLIRQDDTQIYSASLQNYEFNLKDDVRILDEGQIFVKSERGFFSLDECFEDANLRKLGDSQIIGNLTFRILIDLCKDFPL